MLQQGIAPVGLAQAAVGPGMAVFSRYAKVVESSGSRCECGLRWAIRWFEQHGLDEGPCGEAEVLATAMVTSIGRLIEAGILDARAGKEGRTVGTVTSWP